jgi:transposase
MSKYWREIQRREAIKALLQELSQNTPKNPQEIIKALISLYLEYHAWKKESQDAGIEATINSLHPFLLHS